MKFNKEKKASIIYYILDKISQKDENISKHVSETFNINQNTVHVYINQLVENNIIKRVKRGEYELVSETFTYHLKRESGNLDSDTFVFNKYMKEHIKNLPQNIKTIWEYTFSEMINNVIDHSEAENVTISIASNHYKTSVAIIDNGIGIFEKIKNYFNYETLDDAICELFKGKLTTDSKNHSGEGIFFSSRIMDDFMIFSSEKVFCHNKYDESVVTNLFSNTVKGTGVYMSISNFSQKQAYEIFDMYANVDGGFTKTTIPLKNIFDSSPVSRSQARRICNRLDKFEKVILDFNNIDWMGQGFAHQIFVVFQNENPDIEIQPVNMNEVVTKMYKHVTN